MQVLSSWSFCIVTCKTEHFDKNDQQADYGPLGKMVTGSRENTKCDLHSLPKVVKNQVLL